MLILRVKEASSQEARLIKTGKYKEVQRLNVKRAIKFMLDNYALNERFVKAASFAPSSQVMTAGQYGQNAVESLTQVPADDQTTLRPSTRRRVRRIPARAPPGTRATACAPPRRQILEYFPDKLVANDLTREQEKFVMAALDNTNKARGRRSRAHAHTACACASASAHARARARTLPATPRAHTQRGRALMRASLAAWREQNIDLFCELMPPTAVDAAKAQLEEENKL